LGLVLILETIAFTRHRKQLSNLFREFVHQAARGTEQVNSSIMSVSEASGEAGAASECVLSTAGQLSSQVQALKNEVDAFINKVQAA
jgi:methyl-accepting chemotaxis protein